MNNVTPLASPATLERSPNVVPFSRIAGGMSHLSNDARGRKSRRNRAPRRYDQAALLTARMSPEQRDLVKEVAHALGMSVAEYVLARAEEDRRRVSLFGRVAPATLSGDNSTTNEGPHRSTGEVPHAKAGRAVTAAAG